MDQIQETHMSTMLVIGEVAFDRLYFAEGMVDGVGGAGMYTAMAARRCGTKASLFGLKPDPVPDQLKPISERLVEWLGLPVQPELLPQFEISYRGGRTEYLGAARGAEPWLKPSMLPADLSNYDLVHITAQCDMERQLDFVQGCQQRGAAKISGGTDPVFATEQPQAVRKVMEQCDLFFMNGREAQAVFGSVEAACTESGKVLFVTQGEKGAIVIQGQNHTFIPAESANVEDPTGAGDTFCGATLAFLLQNAHPSMAAKRAMALAAEMIGQVGPTSLLSEKPPPVMPMELRVIVNENQIRDVAELVAAYADPSLYPLVGPAFPAVDHPKAADYFFAATLQQFGFWSVRNRRYKQPLIAVVGGVERKGSDYLWYALTKRLEKDAEFCSPERQAKLSRGEFWEVFRSDDGQDPMPALDLHLEQARSYGRDMLALQLTPREVLQKSRTSNQSLKTFLLMMDHIGGYKEDPLRKKSLLLALILKNRPEHFLPLGVDEQIRPIVDYHMMRLCLRIGLIQVVNEELKGKLINRQIVSPDEEWAVRYAAYLALGQLVSQSGRGLSAVNSLLFTSARQHCVEMVEPDCDRCQLALVCAQRTKLFQPVFRTTSY